MKNETLVAGAGQARSAALIPHAPHCDRGVRLAPSPAPGPALHPASPPAAGAELTPPVPLKLCFDAPTLEAKTPALYIACLSPKSLLT